MALVGQKNSGNGFILIREDARDSIAISWGDWKYKKKLPGEVFNIGNWFNFPKYLFEKKQKELLSQAATIIAEKDNSEKPKEEGKEKGKEEGKENSNRFFSGSDASVAKSDKENQAGAGLF